MGEAPPKKHACPRCGRDWSAVGRAGYTCRDCGITLPASLAATSGAPGGRPLPKIETSGRPLHQIAEDAWQALLQGAGRRTLFQHNSTVAEVVVSGGGCRIDHLTAPALRGLLDRAAEWTKADRKTWPPVDVVRDMLAMQKPLPELRRVVGTPVFSADGVLVAAPGYHPASGLYYEPLEASVALPVPKSPSPQDVERARALLLNEWLGDFPFADEAARAHALAAPLASVLREMIDGPTPLFAFDAPAPGSGKGLLAQTTGLILDGAVPAVLAEAGSKDEQRKRITALLSDGASVVLLDNVKYRIDSAALAAALTSTVWKDRILGRTEMVQIPNRALWLVTGNNLQLDVEIARRTVWIRLDARVDRPWEREGFQHDPLVPWVRANRRELVWALLVLCAHWLALGRPAWSGRPLGSFEEWSRIVGGVLESVGIGGFLENREELYKRADAETDEWRAFIAVWWERHQDQPVTVAELYPLIQEHELLPSVFRGTKDGASDRSMRTKLGTALRRQADRRYADWFIKNEGHDSRTKAAMYRLEAAENASVDAEPLAHDGRGSAEVPRQNGAVSGSSAEPTEPAEHLLAAEREMEIGAETQSRDASPIEVPHLPHVPQTGSEASDLDAERLRNLPSRLSKVPHCPGCGRLMSVVAVSKLCGRCQVWGVVPEWAEVVARREKA